VTVNIQRILTMNWRPFLVLVLAAAVTTVAVAAPPSSERKSSTKKGSGLARKKAKDDEPETETPAQPPTTAQPGSGQIVIHRQPLHLRAPEKYQVPMHLEPLQTVRVASPFDGVVKALLRKPGQKIETATEIARMDVTAKQLMLDRAKALYRAAQLEAEQLGGGKGSSEGAGASTAPINRQLADARLAAAKADLDLASYWVDQGSLRAPFSSEVFGVLVAEGQVVRMGDPLVVLGDTSSLKVEVPVDRASTSVGQSISIKVEDQVMSGKVEALLPLSSRFEPLRDLLPSAALASVVLKNSEGALKAGQTVYSPLVPRDLVADVPNSCIGNVGDGGHKVQVLRGDTVRDVAVATLAAVGDGRSFVTGPFRDGDEVIESSSQELADGTVVRSSPMAAPAKSKAGATAGHAATSDKSAAEKPSTGGI
jgi:multidrug efflux pump subunit AcrA (membrane-fusion protein)